VTTTHVPVVVSADEMDDETFILHFERRHNDQMPNLDRFVHTAVNDPVTMSAYRTFHDQLHRFYAIEEQHEHE
jgi:hypothetical protein